MIYFPPLVQVSLQLIGNPVSCLLQNFPYKCNLIIYDHHFSTVTNTIVQSVPGLCISNKVRQTKKMPAREFKAVIVTQARDTSRHCQVPISATKYEFMSSLPDLNRVPTLIGISHTMVSVS